MRTTVDLPEPLLKSAKRLAAQQSATLSAVVEDALRVFLARKSIAPAAPFRLHTVGGRLVQPTLDLDRTSALAVADDEAAYGKGQ